MSNPVISVEHLSKQYDLGVVGTGSLVRDFERWWARVRKQPDPYAVIGHEHHHKKVGETILALDDISFNVQQGETLGIIGKNGAGKSTLLKILSRVTAPTSGVVKVKGRIGSLLEVGTGFHPELTGRENVYLNGAILGMKKEEVTRKFDEIVAFSGVEKFIDTPVKRYSSGMYVRLAFAVAAHLDPEILIVDEVLAVGDVEFQKKCLGKMGDVAGEGRTVLFVSHNLESIKTLCNYSLLLQDGCIKYEGDTELTVSSYISEASASTYIAPESKNGTPHISHIWFSNKGEVLRDAFCTGEQISVNLELNDLNNGTYFVDLSFVDSGNKKLWTFSHKDLNIPPIENIPNSKVKFSFQLPKINLSEVFVHAGLHKQGVSNPYYLDHIREDLRFLIEDNQNASNEYKNTLLSCTVDYQEIFVA